ncbi:MAG: phasin family protein [Magnetococcales bacterium]|nr:phasin family protein [Magnetococcales bacterium]MBF0156791.1 phasin family protein [Magnetococcales bacterium]
MDSKLAEQMTDVTKKVLDSMLRLQEINDRTVQNLAKQQLEVAGSCMSAGVKQIRKISGAKDVKEAMVDQADMASELGELMIGHAKQAMETLTQSKLELNELVEKNLKAFLAMSKAGKE